MVSASTLRHQCRAKALLIALSYEGRTGVKPLHTTHADQDRLAQHLVEHWGYCPQCITKMRDGHTDPDMWPTRKNIFREIANLVRGVKRGDRRVFYFAGHCYQVVNRRGTEMDNLDEIILVDGDDVPTSLCERDKGFLDFWKVGRMERKKIQDGTIIDNELRLHLVDRMPNGAKLMAICDTCNSGTLFDLDYHWQDDERRGFRMKTLVRLPFVGRKWKRFSLDLVRPYQRLKKTATDVGQRDEVVVSLGTSMQSLERGRNVGIKASGEKNGVSVFGDMPRCLSPPPRDMPEVTSLASCNDGEPTVSNEDSMTVVLIGIIETLEGPITTRDLVQQLNLKMKELRCEWMQVYFKKERRNSSYIEAALKKIRRIQQPVIGSLSRKTPEKIFEL